MAIKFVTWLAGLTNKATPDDADELYVRQASDDTSRSTTWANIKTALGGIFAKTGAIGSSGLTVGTGKLVGRGTAGTGPLEEITLGTNLSLTGNTLNAAGGSSLTLAASKLAGRGSAGGTGPAESITLGTNLSMAGNTLNATGGGTPGGANTQLQFNNSGAFGGDANMTWDSTLKRLTLVSTYTSPAQVVAPSFEIKNAAGVSKIGAGVYNSGWVVNSDYFVATATGQFNGMIAGGNAITSASGWWNITQAGLAFPYAAGYVGFGASNSVDVAFCRNAAGVMELDSGTTGTFRDLKLRNLIGTGNLATGAVAKTADYTATTSNGTIEVDASGAASTITLFAASGNAGKIIVVKKTDSSANAVTIDGNATETIDGAATVVLSTQWASAMLQVNATGTAWIKI